MSKNNWEIENNKEDSILNQIRVEKNKIVTCQLWNDTNVHIDSPICPFDKALMDAIYTLYIHGITVFTDAQIEKVLCGNKNKRSTENNIALIHDCIKRLANIQIEIDYTAQMRARKACDDGKQYIYTSHVLPIVICKVLHSENGLITEGYQILQKPLLYQYGEAINQIIGVDPKLLDTQHLFSDTKESVLIKRYVIQRVMQMKNKNNNLLSNRISLVWSDNSSCKGLLCDLGFPEDIRHNRKKMSRIRDCIVSCLNHLVANKEIQSYSAVKKGSSIIGYDIAL